MHMHLHMHSCTLHLQNGFNVSFMVTHVQRPTRKTPRRGHGESLPEAGLD